MRWTKEDVKQKKVTMRLNLYLQTLSETIEEMRK